jgi:hypothetical protein
MPWFGGSCPFPLRFGGGTPLIKTLARSIAAQLGTAFDTIDTSTLLYVELQAEARVLAAAWRQNERLGNQSDPFRMTDFLPRWEKIYGLYPLPTDTMSKRRAKIAVAMARAGYADGGTIFATCLAYLGASVFVGLVNTPSSSALVWTPSGWPMGNHPVLPTDPDWSSSVAYLAIQVQQPANMPASVFYATVATMMPALDAILPAWVTFDWFRQDISGSSGFYLDDLPNLDDEAFDS